jgi:hypothetical protein
MQASPPGTLKSKGARFSGGSTQAILLQSAHQDTWVCSESRNRDSMLPVRVNPIIS